MTGTRQRAPLPHWIVAYTLLIGAFLAFCFACRFIYANGPNYMLPIAGAMGALALVVFGGTRLCLPLYFCTTFTEQLVLPGIPFSLNKALAGTLLLALIVDVLKTRPRIRWGWPQFFFILFQLYYIPLAIIKHPPNGDYPTQTVFYMLLTFAAALLFWQERWLRWMILAMTTITVFMAVIPGMLELAVRQNVTVSGLSGPLDRLNGLAKNAIVFGYGLIYAVPFVFLAAVQSRRLPLQALCLGIILTFVLLAFATGNRQTPIILAGVLVVQLFFLRHPARRTLATLVIVGVLATAPFVAGKMIARYTSVTGLKKDFSLTIRRDKLLVAWNAFLSDPWFGIGNDYYKDTWRKYLPKGEMHLLQYQGAIRQNIDSGYVQILTEYGIVGSTIVFFMIVSSFVFWLRMYRQSLGLDDPFWTNYLAAIAAMFAAFLVSLFIQDNLMTPRTFLLFGLLFATKEGVERARERAHAQA